MREHDPPILALKEIQDDLVPGLFEPFAKREVTLVVEDDRLAYRLEYAIKFRELFRGYMDPRMPTEL